eukprot:c24971_g1_i1 orf=184-1965(+)
MSGRMHSKQSRGWDRVSPARRRPGAERGKVEHFHRRDTGSPDRSKRGRWESPSGNRMDSPSRMRRRDFESPPRPFRKDVISPLKSRRGGFDDGPRPSLSERRRVEEEYHVHAMHQDGHREGQGPAGLVFLCSSSTLRECFHFRVLGLPAAQREIVERVVPGTKLFLFNFDTKELFGVFEAASRGGLNLVPEAFLDFKGTYDAQVRFKILRECLPLADDIVRDVLRENFSQRGKFDCELSADQVLKIMQLFSHQEMRPGHPGQEREKVGQDSRSIPLGVNALEPDGHRLSSALHGTESQLLMNRALADGANPDPAVILGQGMIEQVDQLALKYLQNNPGFVGIRLDPVNMSLLSSSLRNNPRTSFSNPSMDRDQANFAAASLQPMGPRQGVPFPAGGDGIPNPRFLGHLGSSVPDAANMDRMEHRGADGGKILGRFMPGSIASERGLLPIPAMPHHVPLQPGMPVPNQAGFPLQPGMPNQPGMMHPFPDGASVPGAFPMAAGGLGGARPEFGGPYAPFHPLQGPHGIPPHVVNPPQPPQLANRPNNRQVPISKVANKPKKNKQRKRSRNFKVLGGEKDDKKDDAGAEALESADA